MSENEQTDPVAGAETASAAGQNVDLSNLMAGGAPPTTPTVDLAAEALRAAEAALAAGEGALKRATDSVTEAVPRLRSGRELFLRWLIAANVLALLWVAWLPPATATVAPEPTPVPVAEPTPATPHGQVPEPAAIAPSDPWTSALRAADQQDWKSAIQQLEQYLKDSPRMAPSQRISVLMALGYYSSRIGDFTAAQEYQRRADALEQSHSLPEDLIAMANAAASSGDQEALRRVWARFLLQQKQVPSWLYKHVAEAYLQLGDSYRSEANAAAEQARVAELAALAARLREAPEGK